MTIGVGGSTAQAELAKLSDMTAGVSPIGRGEFDARLQKARTLMTSEGLEAVYLNAGTNLYYFTGTRWYASERLVGAIVTQDALHYICPAFEIDTVKDFMGIEGEIHGWEEHESPYELFGNLLVDLGITAGRIGMDESTSFAMTNGIRLAHPGYDYVDAKPVTAGCRTRKTKSEIALIKRAMEMTIEVHKAAARILREGITTAEVKEFIHEAHKRVGAPKGSYFVIVLFGKATSFPHGVSYEQTLKEGDTVLIDTGCQLHDYISDITRTYVFGEPNAKQREVWNVEKAAQAAAFKAAQLGTPCGDVDTAARAYVEIKGYGPGYKTPGVPHRTGHGIGLDIHEWPYLVKSDRTPLDVGMTFSNEPMMVIDGEFGVRLEDHFYMAEDGPKWFTQPSHSIDDPFGLEA
ncbi:M24 family metallopeptidase [Kordiimonas lacus]|uniref:Xaa-Pro dipeptidase n=1 Tax=Kordiimonas lacus TaxID=637679 RepID=A0A1G6UDL6_9PROT|nr:Xaa-Pro peptidase family protein [Kordiimonas lacus]SDD39413.1 Xaa-Pro dipeptidase [Kordiimonas lacus]